MIYILTVGIIIEKTVLFVEITKLSFQIMSETVYKYICKIVQIYVPGMGSLTPRFVYGGFVHNCPEGLPPSSRVRGFVPGGWFWMKLIAALA